MTFGDAIEAMKGGRFVRRKGWNGKGMWLALWSPGTYEAGHPLFDNAPQVAKFIAKYYRSKAVDVYPSIIMKTADAALVFGWLASQADMLSEDWAEVTEAEALG